MPEDIDPGLTERQQQIENLSIALLQAGRDWMEENDTISVLTAVDVIDAFGVAQSYILDQLRTELVKRSSERMRKPQ